MTFDPEFWRVFHDGAITKLDGGVPGDVELFVEISYLRTMFPGNGEGFCVRLNECSFIEFSPFDQPVIQSLAAIEEAQPEVLYVQTLEPVTLGCTSGMLSFSYKTAQIFLDTGERISCEQLAQASHNYWSAWEKKRSK